MKLTQKDIKRHKRWYRFLQKTVGPIYVRKYGFSLDKSGAELPKGAYIFLANHNTDYDPILLSSLLPHMYYVASDNILRRGWSSGLLKRYFAPIGKQKDSKDAAAVLGIKRVLRSGNAVAIFPEGHKSLDGRTHRIDAATGMLLKKIGVPVVTCRISGGFFTSPRWSFTKRKGEMKASVVSVYPPDFFSDMNYNDINTLIQHDLDEDAYKTQRKEMVLYKGRRLAEGLETAIFYCPSCGKEGALSTKRNILYCSCMMEMEYGEDGFFHGKDCAFDSFTDLYDWQVQRLRTQVHADEVSFCDKGLTIFTRKSYIPVITEYNEIFADIRGIKLLSKSKAVALPFESIIGISIFTRNKLLINTGHERYELHSKNFNARKYLHLYEIIKTEAKPLDNFIRPQQAQS